MSSWIVIRNNTYWVIYIFRSGFGTNLHFIDDITLELWFSSYIDLLQRLELYNNASILIKTCSIPSIQQMSQQSTTYLSNCTKCNKALSRKQGSWWCERCEKTPNLCSVCRQIGKFVKKKELIKFSYNIDFTLILSP